MQNKILKKFFLAKPITNGYTWTLTSRLGDMIFEAEKLFGPRDKDYTILGIEFTSDDIPKIWYPYPEGKNEKHIVIQVSDSAISDIEQIYYQMAHEVIHCLSPIDQKDSTILEEGIACWFASKYILEKLQINRFQTPEDKKYAIAQCLITKLFEHEYNIEAIKNLRLLRKTFLHITMKDLEENISNNDKGILLLLCEKFLSS